MYERVEDYDPVLRWPCRVPEPEESDPDGGDEPAPGKGRSDSV